MDVILPPANKKVFIVIELPPSKITVFPDTVTPVNGVPYVGKSKNVFQSVTLVALATGTLSISSKVSCNKAIIIFYYKYLTITNKKPPTKVEGYLSYQNY